MAYIEYKVKDFIPNCVDAIVQTGEQEFRTCEILTRIENLMSCEERKLLKYPDKITMLKSLKKGLELKLKEQYLINNKQHNTTKNVFHLIDKKIDEYTVLQYNAAPIPKIYKPKRRRL